MDRLRIHQDEECFHGNDDIDDKVGIHHARRSHITQWERRDIGHGHVSNSSVAKILDASAVTADTTCSEISLFERCSDSVLHWPSQIVTMQRIQNSQ